LLNYDQEDPATQREFLGIINAESERLTRLINDVLDLSRIEAGGMVWHDEVVLLEEILQDILPTHQGLLEEKSIRLTLDLSSDLPPVCVDRDRIQQVLRNLLVNAVKFSHQGGKIVVKAETFEGRRTEEASEWIKVSVSDEGIGIDERDFEIIFDRFRQVSSDTLRDKPQGTGLGLPICRDIVVHYGGNIWVESRKGEGSTFFFSLPAAAERGAHTARACEVLPAGGLPEADRNGKTILVVEENRNTRRVLRSQLERKGFSILEASDADQALGTAREEPVDLILLDLMMPRLGEDDLLGVFKRDPATENVPVLIVSVVESTGSGILPGAYGFLRKPFREEELIYKVQTLLQDRNRSILVVDDSPGVRNSLQLQLEDMGYPVYLAENGEEAMELLRVSVPDLVILDVIMPDMGGQDVLAWIRNNEDTRDLPVIILTGYPLFGELDRLRSLGIEACVEKSENLSSLFTKIDSILEAPAR
jgi:CheY-like chemotaxis protein/anti-sigma regulatory factor (Ser/Thr protein kinase)